jgi:hypothetical protein
MASPTPPARSLVTRASQAWRAARAALRGGDPEDALPWIVLGWAQLARLSASEDPQQKEGPTEPPAGLTERLRAHPPAGLSKSEQDALLQALPELQRKTEALLAGEAVQAPDRATLEAHHGRLKRAVRAARRIHLSMLQRAGPWVLPAAAAALLALLAAAGGGLALDRADRGWRAAYYTNDSLEGTPVVRREPNIEHMWFDQAPLEQFPEDQFSVRWDTCLVLDRDRTVEALAGSDDGLRLYLDGNKVVDEWKTRGFTSRPHAFELSAGVHHVRVEYFEQAKDAAVLVLLQSPGPEGERLDLAHFRLPTEPWDPGDPCR